MSASKPAIGQPVEDPVRAALAAAPHGDSSLLTQADRERIEANRRLSVSYLTKAKRALMFGACMALGQPIIGLIHYGWTRDAFSFAASRAPEVFLIGIAVNLLLNFGKDSS
jgi:hypothetical protein